MSSEPESTQPVEEEKPSDSQTPETKSGDVPSGPETGHGGGHGHGKSKKEKKKTSPLTILLIGNLALNFFCGFILFGSHNADKSKASIQDFVIKGPKSLEDFEREQKEREEAEKKKVDDALPGISDPNDGKYARMFTMDQMLVNLYPVPNAPPKYVRITLAFNVKTREVEKEFKNRVGEIKNIVIDLVNSKTLEELRTIKGRSYLTFQVQDSVNKVMTKGKIQGVYINQLMLNN